MPVATCQCGKRYSYRTRRGVLGPCCRSRSQKGYQREYRENRTWRQLHLWSRYRITEDQFNEILAEQGGGCAICGCGDAPENKLSVDHCHRTNTIRGILCQACNKSLGGFRDDPEILSRAIDYLELGVVEIPIVKKRYARRVKGGG